MARPLFVFPNATSLNAPENIIGNKNISPSISVVVFSNKIFFDFAIVAII
jgi:hypothetical protein